MVYRTILVRSSRNQIEEKYIFCPISKMAKIGIMIFLKCLNFPTITVQCIFLLLYQVNTVWGINWSSNIDALNIVLYNISHKWDNMWGTRVRYENKTPTPVFYFVHTFYNVQLVALSTATRGKASRCVLIVQTW